MAFDTTQIIEATDVAVYVGPPPLARPGAYDTAAELAAFPWNAVPSTLSAGAGTGNEYTLLGEMAEETAITISPDVSGGELRNTKHTNGVRKSKIRVNWSITLPALQISNRTLSMLTGGGDAATADTFLVGKDFIPDDQSLFLVFADSVANLALHVPLGSPMPSGDLSLAGTDGLTELGLTISVMDEATVNHLMAFIRDGLGA